MEFHTQRMTHILMYILKTTVSILSFWLNHMKF